MRTTNALSAEKNDPTEWCDTTLTFEVLGASSTRRGRLLVPPNPFPSSHVQLTRVWRQGTGWSVWRGQRIQFGIQGSFCLVDGKVGHTECAKAQLNHRQGNGVTDSPQRLCQVTLVKTHRGKYRNQVQYTGIISVSRLCLNARLCIFLQKSASRTYSTYICIYSLVDTPDTILGAAKRSAQNNWGVLQRVVRACAGEHAGLCMCGADDRHGAQRTAIQH